MWAAADKAWGNSADGPLCGDRYMTVTFFATLQPEELLESGRVPGKMSAPGSGKWYYGLISEWNNETGMPLGPDNYDRIGGWRIY